MIEKSLLHLCSKKKITHTPYQSNSYIIVCPEARAFQSPDRKIIINIPIWRGHLEQMIDGVAEIYWDSGGETSASKRNWDTQLYLEGSPVRTNTLPYKELMTKRDTTTAKVNSCSWGT
ncbi:hypothetical protein PROFUN_14720 [Planoprotostelium fungivorum]|uniref:Uncharacterized protein n=1 Tax=Planoprotostelium fungivorum TaxID=1890364 RepID=A0A2P6MZ75_9EUKA|nr:hypothetical protein PROFUN_14720 [Planoprotostelium fungivorum]